MEERKSKMSKKEDIIAKIKTAHLQDYPMPDLDALHGIEYSDPVAEFKEMSENVGAKIIEATDGDKLDDLIRQAYPDAKVIATNLEGISMATVNPDTVAEAQDLNGTDVAVLKGEIGVAENGCVWIPQTMKERAVCFIAEQLVILLERCNIVSNMHEAYSQIGTNEYGYGCFISGPSKTADIAQALVMGAQAARGVTIVLI